MESYIKVKATQKEMNEIFDNTESGFLIKLVDIIEEGQENNLYKVVVRRGDYIGEQDGKTSHMTNLWKHLKMDTSKKEIKGRWKN